VVDYKGEKSYTITIASLFLDDLTYIIYRHFLFESKASLEETISSQLLSYNNLIYDIGGGRSSSFRFPHDCTFVLTSLDFKLSSIQNIPGMSSIGDEPALGVEEEEKRDD